jgi:4-amino-4-deoxy-L-arabinose transferase-like glycosyltransferase
LLFPLPCVTYDISLMKNSLTRAQWVLIITLSLTVAPYFVRLGASSLWDANEAFYAETPREMIEANDYVNPTFNYRPRLNKPPLSYWVVVPFYKLFGVSESTERLPIVLGALTMIATAFALGRILFSLEAGLLAAIGLAVAPRFLMFSRRILIDVYVSMFMALALLMYVCAEKDPKRRRRYLILMYVFIGLGVLTKGPVAAVLPAAVLFVYFLVFRRLKSIGELMLPVGCLIVAVIVLPWYVAIYLQHGWGHIESFILKDNLSRYTQPIWGPRRGFFFYIPALIGDFFPWSLFLIPLACSGLKHTWSFGRNKFRLSEDLRGSALLALWVLLIVFFFSLSKSKEDLYILPIYPAAAALAGNLIAESIVEERQRLFTTTLLIIGLSIAAAGGAIAYFFAHGIQPYDIADVNSIGWLAIVGGVAAGVALVIGRYRAALLATALSVASCNWVFVTFALPDFERFKPVRSLCKVISTEAGPDALVGYYRTAYPSMVYYLHRPIFEYYHQEEIEAAFSSGKDVFCLMSSSEFEALKPRLPQSRVLASNPTFQVKLNVILERAEPPRVVLITNKGGASVP